MKAVLCTSYNEKIELEYGHSKEPEMASDEVLVKVAYAGVNFPDTLIVQGKYQFKPELPFSPGQEVSGQVIAVGSEVTHVSLGDLVVASMTWGGFAEYAVAKGINTYHLPDKLALKDGAAILETYGTAMHALRDRATIQPGETLVVLGASGGTGTAAIQLGRAMGCKVIAIASTVEKRAFVKANGAHEVLAPDGFKTAVKELGGADVVFDPVGGTSSEAAFRTLNFGGRHLVVGFAAGVIPAIPLSLPLLKSAAIVGVFWGGFWRAFPEKNRKNIQQVLSWFQEGKLSVKITESYSLEQAQQALLQLVNRKAHGKMVLHVQNL